MTDKKERFPKHMMGKSCGYDLLEDGGIVMAPGYAEQYAALDDERRGVEALLQAVQNHCASLLTNISARRRGLFARMSDDYGLDNEAGYLIRRGNVLYKEETQPKRKSRDR